MGVLTKRTSFDDYLFRCHALNNIMIGADKGLTDRQEFRLEQLQQRQNGHGKPLTDNMVLELAELIRKRDTKKELSQTAKSYLEKIFNEEFHGRSREFSNKYTEKGIIMQEKGTSLYADYLREVIGIKKPPITNKERYVNKYITGEPDFIFDDVVYDIKCSWSLDSFPQHDSSLPSNDYLWQVKAYCWLTGLKRAKVVYCLLDTPEHLVMDEKYRVARNLGVMDLPDEVEEEIEWMHNYSDLSTAEKIREFEVDIEEGDSDLIIQQVELAREYLNLLSKTYQEKFNLKTEAA